MKYGVHVLVVSFLAGTLPAIAQSPDLLPDGAGARDRGSMAPCAATQEEPLYPAPSQPLAARVHCWLGPTAGRGGLGRPLHQESWLDEPLSVGWFIGAMHGGAVVDDWVGLDTGLAGGFRFGGDVGHYWGFETRVLAAESDVEDHPEAIAAQWDADTAAGLDQDDPWRRRFDAGREAKLFQWDLSVLYYPWGETAWRPYLAVGLGQAHLELTDRLSQHVDRTTLAVPIAAGVKYRAADWMAVRVEVADMIHLGGGRFETLHNLTYTAGAEFRFGGVRRGYWPWEPGRHTW